MESVRAVYKDIEVIKSKDVVVCGGGPAGIAAAISASKNGADVSLIERNGYLGGASTASRVSIFAYGFHDKERYIVGGIFKEIRDRLYTRNALIKTDRKGWEPYNPFEYKVLLDEMIDEYKVDVLYHANISDVILRNKNIDSVILPSKSGYKAIKGQVFVDCTGDCDIAAFGGSPIAIGREKDNATQPMTSMYLIGGVDWEQAGKSQTRGFWQDKDSKGYISATGFGEYINNAVKDDNYNMPYYGISSIFSIPWMDGVVGINFGRIHGKSGLKLTDVTEAEKEGRRQIKAGLAFLKEYVPGFRDSYVVAAPDQVGIRETRRIIGEYTLTEKDIISLTQFDDIIAQSCYMIDVHSPDGADTYLYKLPKGKHHDIPYRSLIPKGLDNLLVAGRCISATQNALGAIRVQPICMALGEAAGAAAALGSLKKINPIDIDINQLQEVLAKQGAILA